MFSSITWQEFLKVAAISTGVYYTVAIVLLYRDEIKARITGKWKGSVPRDEINDYPPQQVTTLIGDIKEDEAGQTANEGTVSAEQIKVFTNSKTSPSENDALNGLTDILEEAKIILQSISENSIGKNESIELFKSLLAKYPHLKDTKYQDAVDFFIHDTAKEQCQFDLSMSEVRSFWL